MTRHDPVRKSDSPSIAEMMRRVRRIDLNTRRLVDDAVSGQYHSIFRGRGMNYEDVRRYQPGDDIRAIDWNVTARTGEPHIKLFTEERELTLMLALDVSASGSFGSVVSTKRETAAEAAAILAFSAVRNADKIGAALFTDRTELLVPPRKGRSHALRLLRDMLYHRSEGMGTNLAGVIESLTRLLSRRSVVFVISDFESGEFAHELGIMARKHDVIAVRVTDPRELELPDMGWTLLEDSETGEQISVNTSSATVRKRFREAVAERRASVERVFLRHAVDLVELSTARDVLPPLRAFFSNRGRRSRIR